jgi:hypothetical protein
MKQKKNALKWFQHKVDTGGIHPIHLDLSRVPDTILAELDCEKSPDGEISPSQTIVNVALFLFIACKFALQLLKQRSVCPFDVTQSELVNATERILILAALENLKRQGFLNYRMEGLWIDEDAEIFIQDRKSSPMGQATGSMVNKFVNFN